MIRFLAQLLELLNRWLDDRAAAKVRREVREATIKEMNDAIDAAVDKAEAAVATPDPERDQRLRSRFDRAAGTPADTSGD